MIQFSMNELHPARYEDVGAISLGWVRRRINFEGDSAVWTSDCKYELLFRLIVF